MKKDFFKIETLEMNIDDYNNIFEDIELQYMDDMKEPEYKQLINNALLESFNKSYSKIIDLYIRDEIINKINSLISDKLDIFIKYFLNKLKNDFQYYLLLLEHFEELGNSSKISIINLFSKIPKKLNESIDYILEDEIFHYIDIFFGENKNIFTDNFIEFYLNKENHFNLNIFKIEDYVVEMISNNDFNQTLYKISSHLISDMKNKIKEYIRNITSSKMKSFIEQCDKISNNIKIKLNQIGTNKLPDEMNNLVNLINNQSKLVENQNSKYIFNMGQSPFNKMNIFINQTLEPPLLLICDKYSLIEQELLNKIFSIVENFPDAYSEVKKYLIGTRINSTDDFINEINPTLLDYRHILVNELENYFNKLIKYVYIDGLEVTDCQVINCGIPLNPFRRLSNKEINDIINIYKGHHNLQNITKIEKKINKNINLGIKRKTSSLPEYTPDMGALTESDVIYYLSNLQNTTLKFNKSFFLKDYSNLNLVSKKFLQNINFTFLEKLRLSFDKKLIKFSTILTEDKLNQLKDIILEQYYLIEEYVHKSSDLVQNKINYFCNELQSTSEFLQSLSGYIYNQVMGYYEILYTTIQSQFKNLADKVYDSGDIIGKSLYTNQMNNTKTTVNEIVGLFQAKIKVDVDLTHILKLCLSKTSLGKMIDKIDRILNPKAEFKKSFPIPFPAIPILQIRIGFSVSFEIGFEAAVNPDWETNEWKISFDIYGEAKVETKVEGGVFIPPTAESPMSMSFSVGLDGIIGQGKAGLKLEICVGKNIDFDAYFIFNALVFEFFVQVKTEVKFAFISFEVEYDIIRMELCGFHSEFHSNEKAQIEAFKKNKKNQVDSPFSMRILSSEKD